MNELALVFSIFYQFKNGVNDLKGHNMQHSGHIRVKICQTEKPIEIQN